MSEDRSLSLFADKESLAAAAADLFAAAAAKATARRGRFLTVLSGGSTPNLLFHILADPDFSRQIDWPAVHLFWGDERLVPPDNPGSNYFQARRLLLDKVPIPAAQVHRLRGELAPADAVQTYRRQLQAYAGNSQPWPRFDLALMGLGADGHTASLFPGSAAALEKRQSVLAVTAAYAGRPAQRATLTPPVFNDAHQILFLVTGEEKAAALAAVIEGPRDIEKWPAQGIQPLSGSLTWFADKPAASLLSHV